MVPQRIVALVFLATSLAYGALALFLENDLPGGCVLLGERRPRIVIPTAVGVAVVFQVLLTRLLGIYVEDPLLQLLGVN